MIVSMTLVFINITKHEYGTYISITERQSICRNWIHVRVSLPSPHVLYSCSSPGKKRNI